MQWVLIPVTVAGISVAHPERFDADPHKKGFFYFDPYREMH